MLTIFLITLAAGLILGGIVHLCDLHIAIYRPKIKDRNTHFYLEIGNPDTSEIGKGR